MSSQPAAYPLAIVGAGALGLHFAARLATCGPVAVIARESSRAAALRAGVLVGERLFHAEAFGPDELPRADWVILLVKAGDTPAAARTALALGPRGVLSLQNGLTGQVLREVCGNLHADQGITTEGAYRDSTRVVPSGAGETLVPPGFEAVATQLAAAGFRARVDPDIAAARLVKLLVNLAINPLAALNRVPNGALLDPPHRAVLEALVTEAWPVLRAAGLKIDADAALARVIAVAHTTATNRASMLQDVEAGRPTEIDAITGSFLAMADAQAAAVPTHRAVFTRVKALEALGRAEP